MTLPINKAVPKNNRSLANAISAVANGKTIHVFQSTTGNRIQVLTSRNITKFTQTANLDNLAPWKVEFFKGVRYDTNGEPLAQTDDDTVDDSEKEWPIHFRTSKCITSLVSGAFTYFFWIERTSDIEDEKEFLCMGRINPAAKVPLSEWAQIFLPLEQDQGMLKPLTVPSRSVGVCMHGSTGQFIVSYADIGADGNTLALKSLLLDTNHIDMARNMWLASGGLPDLDISAFAPTKAKPANATNFFGPYVNEMTIKSIAVHGINPNTKAFQSMLIVGITNPFATDSGSRTIVSQIVVDTDSNSPQSYNLTAPREITWPAVTGVTQPAYQLYKGISFCHEPSGRITVLMNNNNRSVCYANLNTKALMSDTLANASAATLAWNTVSAYSEVSDNASRHEAPYAVYTGMDPILRAPKSTASKRKNVRMVVFHLGSAKRLNVSNIAVGQVRIDTDILKMSAPNQTLAFMVADPFPMPMTAPYLWTSGSPDGMADWNLFEYEYMASKSTTRSYDLEVTASVGLKFEIEFGFIVYVGLEGSLLLTGGYMHNEKDMTFQARGLKIFTKGFPNPLASDTEQYLIRPYGSYSARLAPDLRQDDYHYFDTTTNADGTEITGTESPLLSIYTPIAAAKGSEVRTGDFFTYASVPGKIESYFKEAINQRMAHMFAQLSEDDIARYFSSDPAVSNGDWRKYYESDPKNYVDMIIEDFAEPLNTKGDKYLSFSLSGSAFHDSQFQSTSSVTNAGMFGMDFSYYHTEGISKGTISVGVESTLDIVNSKTEEASWGVSSQFHLNTLAAGQTMTVRMYLLRASALWAAELKCFPQLAQAMYLDTAPDSPYGEFWKFTHQTPDESLLTDKRNTAGVNAVMSRNGLLFDQSRPQRILFVVSDWQAGDAEDMPASVATLDEPVMPPMPAPVILLQPQHKKVMPSIPDAQVNVTLSVTVSGAPSAYQWQKRNDGTSGTVASSQEGINIPGATSATLALPNVSYDDANEYRCILNPGTDTAVTSDWARVQVCMPVANASFDDDTMVISPGTGTIKSWTWTDATPPTPGSTFGLNPCGGSNDNPYADNGIPPGMGQVAFINGDGNLSQVISGFTPNRQYYLEYFENAREYGTFASKPAMMGVSVTPASPAQIVALHPVNPVGGVNPYVRMISETFTASADTLTLKFAKTSTNQSTNQVNSTVLLDQVSIVAIAPGSAPFILRQPQGQILDLASGSVSLSLGVTAKGDGTLHYQWSKDCEIIAGATGASYTMSSPTAFDLGSYTVTVGNDHGSVTSGTAVVSASGAPIFGLFNTGVDDSGMVLAQGQADPHYQMNGGQAMVVTSANMAGLDWVENDTASMWIGPASFSTGDFIYRTSFDLTGRDPMTAVIVLRWAADDSISALAVNGQPVGSPTLDSWTTWHTFTLNRDNAHFQAGVNTVTITVSNRGGPTGLRLEIVSATAS